tara:strand:+ start:218 stop:340 length:123 start_codon:yes stop_codon:yes gene_type:complete
MKIAVIGLSISAIIVIRTFLKYTYKVDLIDSENVKKEKHG